MRRLVLLLPLLLSAAPLPPSAQPVRLAILGDFNGPYGSTTYPAPLARSVARIVNEWQPDAVLSPGDLIGAQKASLGDAQVRAMWAAFDRDVREPLTRAGIPFAFTLGNHDASPRSPRDRREAATYWAAHVPPLAFVDRAAFPFRFSFTLGSGAVFVASLDASGPDVSAGQRAWLAAQLASPAARAASARLVLGHLPLAGVSAGKNRPGEVLRDAPALRQIMEAGRVLAYVHGHHAAFYPARLGRLNVLSAGGIGGRDYVGHPGTARSTVTLLTVWPAQGRATFETVDAATGQPVDPATLPARLDGLNGPLVRVSDFR
ncbi:metallophosphoesterase [Deinococcus soli (ex Cha et al. 2016)]|uniref:3',5'-cyclic AMP phosphodiesterase CpdA n=2 Tax=Deinococcus soli (ex Cha et al. 2016) TaxID=1309411 RepID=A0ACC6KMC6_9DEIO|nr:metallophosphoesterase [Deinococcus soli (ex Cha et al. 2016)]MDR6220665.1 3',5'-cyclic AMP phosphodiesterase CpdA [Deinococcus soli (ex Cha et al. 2016)]MDR6330520.1 3',5'-cyclic AMP phosphodiesterase CpdA [Deinococcus soli (ex Cha et al. 2016)]MDR6753587.1 3',5'-cyclic AMP phosphodiesterase CpdA [Deinococcus soli (ex Cha et al. 2016)]